MFPLWPGGGSDGSRAGARFRDFVGEMGSLAILLFLADDLPLALAKSEPTPFLRFFVADLGASGEVDMSRSGSLVSI